jgi:hypothetical protein
MSEESSKEHFEWYAHVAEEKLKELKEKEKLETFQDCKTREVFTNYMLNVFIQYYGLRCSCHEWMEWDFFQCGGHYHNCELYRFSYLVNRCLDWAEKHYTKSAETDLSILTPAKQG